MFCVFSSLHPPELKPDQRRETMIFFSIEAVGVACLSPAPLGLQSSSAKGIEH